MKQLVLLILILSAVSVNGQSKIVGRYSRNSPGGDKEITTIIQLNSDSTFLYEVVGHTIHEAALGRYSMNKDNFVELNFVPLMSGEWVKLELDLSNRKLKFKNGKLFELNRKGRIIRTKRLLKIEQNIK